MKGSMIARHRPSALAVVWAVFFGAVVFGVACEKKSEPTTKKQPVAAADAESESADLTSEAPSPTHVFRVHGEFEPTPKSADAGRRVAIPAAEIERLNERRSEIFRQVLERREIVPAEEGGGLPVIDVKLGSEVGAEVEYPGLAVGVTVETEAGKTTSASRQLPPTPRAVELVTNLDHTFSTALDEALGNP